MKSLLLTAFDPFAHYTMNPSWEVVQALPETINNYHIHKLRVPNIFGLAPRLLLEEAQRVQPDVILMTGMNSGTTKIDINLAALNIKDALIEDNMGRKPWNEPILADAPAAYFATIPVHEIVRSLRAQKLPVQLEFASGGYVCNEIFTVLPMPTPVRQRRLALYMCRSCRRWYLTRVLLGRWRKLSRF